MISSVVLLFLKLAAIDAFIIDGAGFWKGLYALAFVSEISAKLNCLALL